MSDTEKYIPKVGEEFEFKHMEGDLWMKGSEVLLVTDREVAYLDNNGAICTALKYMIFRPIPTKVDVEREQLRKILAQQFVFPENKVFEIQQAGFTIPKKVKRSDVAKTINRASCYANSRIDERMCNAICTLLGDLVEQDQ